MNAIQRGPLKWGFEYDGQLVASDGEILVRQRARNLIPQVGIDHIVALLRGDGSLVSNWYVGLFEGNFVPTSSTTAADLPSNAQECQAYSEASRPLWDEEYDGVSIISNLNGRAEFSFTADKRVYGAFLVSESVKGGGGGLLLSIARFGSPFDIPAGTTFRLGVSATVLPSL